jgi:hypothetical protein
MSLIVYVHQEIHYRDGSPRTDATWTGPMAAVPRKGERVFFPPSYRHGGTVDFVTWRPGGEGPDVEVELMPSYYDQEAPRGE